MAPSAFSAQGSLGKRRIMKRAMMVSYRDVWLRNFVCRYLHKKSLQYASSRGHRMAVYANDWIGLSIFLDGVYEKEQIADLLELMSHLGVAHSSASAIDVGANVGNHSLAFARSFSKVYSFEPNPHTFKLLSFNVGFLPNIKAFNLGLSDCDDILVMSEDVTNYGGSSAVYQHNSNSAVNVQVKRLDDVLKDVKDVKLIKIDVEGMELNVLRGAVRMIQDNQPIIVFEQNVREFGEGLESPAIRFLRSLGYEMCLVEVEGENASWVFRKIKNLFGRFLGRSVDRSFVLTPKVPAGTYSMIIALPQTYFS